MLMLGNSMKAIVDCSRSMTGTDFQKSVAENWRSVSCDTRRQGHVRAFGPGRESDREDDSGCAG